MNLEVLVHSQINHLSDYTTRLDTIIQALIKVLNGVEVNGVGVYILIWELIDIVE